MAACQAWPRPLQTLLSHLALRLSLDRLVRLIVAVAGRRVLEPLGGSRDDVVTTVDVPVHGPDAEYKPDEETFEHLANSLGEDFSRPEGRSQSPFYSGGR